MSPWPWSNRLAGWAPAPARGRALRGTFRVLLDAEHGPAFVKIVPALRDAARRRRLVRRTPSSRQRPRIHRRAARRSAGPGRSRTGTSTRRAPRRRLRFRFLDRAVRLVQPEPAASLAAGALEAELASLQVLAGLDVLIPGPDLLDPRIVEGSPRGPRRCPSAAWVLPRASGFLRRRCRPGRGRAEAPELGPYPRGPWDSRRRGG